MSPSTRSDDRSVLTRRYDYDDATEFVVDVGAAAGDVSVDVVDGTLIVVVGDAEREFDLPAEVPSTDARAFNNNGVVTVEVER